MKLKRSLIAAALAVAATGAMADDYVLTLGAGGSASFIASVNGFFLDNYTFSPAAFTGHVAVSFAALTPSVAFAVGDVSGQSFSFFPELGLPTFDFEADVTSDTPLTLSIFGGSYAGAGFDTAIDGRYSVSVVTTPPVPEPGTYALMLAGIGGLGLFARRRQRASST
jgi:hypothetical protein